MKPPVFLRIFLNGKVENVKQFSDAQIVIGSGEESHLRLNNEAVSPVHAVIEERDAGYYISDMGSQSGTFKNGVKIFDEAIVAQDEFSIGPYKIEFFIGVPKPLTLPVEQPPKVGVKKNTANKVTMTSDKYLDVLNSTYRKSRGPIVEVTIVWRERVIATHHYNTKQEVTIGSDERCSIVVPLPGMTKNKMTLLRLETAVTVHITPDMTGDYFKDEEHISLVNFKRNSRMRQVPNGFEFELSQGEALRLGLHGDLLSIYVRYVEETSAPIMGPLFDLTASEATAVLMSFVISALIGLYMLVYTPKPVEDEITQVENQRRATIAFNPPRPKVVELNEETPQNKKIIKVDVNAEKTTTKVSPGKVAELRSRPNAKKTSIVSSNVQQGGTLNTGKAAANAQSQTRDVSKLGLLSTFGGKGAQSQLSKAYSGTGELLGDAAKATGYSGSAESRAGENLGGRLKDVGGGGKGSATYGIADVGTQGKGTGTFGTGVAGIGKRGRVDLNIGEAEAEFTGSIDREAIRRVIRDNRKLFENCYNQALRRNSDSYGKVEIKWHIEERGRATNSVVKSNTVGDKQMGECLARVIRGLTFPEPPPDQIAEVTYPFVFASQ